MPRSKCRVNKCLNIIFAATNRIVFLSLSLKIRAEFTKVFRHIGTLGSCSILSVIGRDLFCFLKVIQIILNYSFVGWWNIFTDFVWSVHSLIMSFIKERNIGFNWWLWLSKIDVDVFFINRWGFWFKLTVVFGIAF